MSIESPALYKATNESDVVEISGVDELSGRLLQRKERRPEESSGDIEHSPQYGPIRSPSLAGRIDNAYFNPELQAAYYYAVNAAIAGVHEGAHPYTSPLSIERSVDGATCKYDNPELLATVPGSNDRIVVLSTDAKTEDPRHKYVVVYVDKTRNEIAEAEVLGVEGTPDGGGVMVSTRLRSRAFNQEHPTIPNCTITLAHDEDPARMHARYTGGKVSNVRLRPRDTVESYPTNVEIAPEINVFVEKIVFDDTETGEGVRVVLDKLMLNDVGHQDPKVRAKESMPGSGYQSPIVLGVSPRDQLAISLRGTIRDIHKDGRVIGRDYGVKSENPSDFRAVVADLKDGKMYHATVSGMNTFDNRFYINLDIKDDNGQVVRQIPVSYAIADGGNPFDVKIDKKNPVYEIGSIVKLIEQRSDVGSLPSLIERDMKRHCQRLARLIITDDNVGDTVVNLMQEYTGVISNNPGGVPKVSRERRGEEVDFDNVIGNVVIDNTIYHIRGLRGDGRGNPQDFLVVATNLDQNTGPYDVRVDWVNFDGERLHIGFKHPYEDDKNPDVQISCDMTKGQSKSFRLSRDNSFERRLPDFSNVQDMIIEGLTNKHRELRRMGEAVLSREDFVKVG